MILGGSGFIGRHLVREMLDHGWSVTVASRHADIRSHAACLPGNLTCVRVDLAETDRMADLLESASVFVHLAHNTVPAESMADLTRDLNGSLLPTVRLLSRLPTTCRRVIFVSSGGTVYGEPKWLPVTEDHPTNPTSAYGVAKLALEKYVQICSAMAGASAGILRPANVYGPGQRADRLQGAIGVFLDRMLRGEPIELWGDGQTVRDYVHVFDVARAIRLAAESDEADVWNVGTGTGSSLNTLLQLLEQTTGVEAQVVPMPERSYDVRSNVLDASRLEAATGWRPRITLNEGIRIQYAALNDNHAALAPLAPIRA